MTKALALMSGGLDSLLAAKLMKDQGIDVLGICFKSYFFGPENAIRMSKQIGVPLEVIDFSKEHLELVKNPKHGYGKNMNPCIDCHAMMMRYAGNLMEKYGAKFIITGEVLNQRPMSQNRSSLDVVKKESGFSDKILRPLCAKNLNPTEMELNGLVDREKLLDISGRNRKVQMELADKWGIKDYPSPAGGCKLTEPNYAKRLKDLLKYNNSPDEYELEMLKIGRHFRTSESAKIISTRTKDEADEIKNLLTENELIFLAEDFNGSMVIVHGKPSEKDIEIAAKVAGRYCKGKNEDKLKIKYGYFKHELDNHIEVKPGADEEIDEYII
ncbi:tRNA 4-thiouridine(8) synthase ThiI [Clostridium sp. JN-1]|uniref:tRNA 4-thiouridine(8) synthase ThiI n=1 Tax=Clostridium sp. JN-1 TaxID=2483110 RepID=UPI000F0B495F|nr:tRNA 4-thiouridine(8) synthase ThiI [Clostridium sp. JN-1]